jgi:predicted transcriptional regulator YdeE
VVALEPKIVQRENILLVGLEYYGSLQGEGWNEENSIGHLWSRWSQFIEEYGHLIKGKLVDPDIGYEIAAWNDEEYENTGQFYIFVGAEIKDIKEALPLQLVARKLPGGTCAKFSVKGEEIQKWEDMFYHEWLPESGYKSAKFDGYSYQIQAYHSGRFKGIKQDELCGSEIEIIVPVDRII